MEDVSKINLTKKMEKKTSSIINVRSREQLLDIEKEYFANEQKIMRQRRTKIIATLSDKSSSIESIKEMLLAGMNIIRVNMAYCDQKTLGVIMKNKQIIEKEQNCFIPVIVDLQGNTMRIGGFGEGREITLKKGDEFRITTNRKVLGDQNIVSCDSDELGKHVQVNDKILIDYGRIVFTVKKIEKESEALAKLREKFPHKYGYGFAKMHKGNLKLRAEDPGESPLSGMSSGHDEDSELSWSKVAADHSSEEREENIAQHSTFKSDHSSEDEAQTLDAQKKSSKERKNKFNERYKKLRRKEDKDVILCEVETDCTIQAHKALFIHTKNPVGFPGPSVTSLDFKDPLVNRTASEQDPDENETCISVKDIKDMNFATQLGVDCIAVSGVHSAEDIKEAKFILGPKTPVRLLSKIQDAKAIEKFDEILKVSDGIIISRGYLSVHIPVEKLYFKQKEMIQKCHAAGKPVIIVSQVLESMVQGVVPTTSEINDIAGLILDGVDVLTLVTETTFGLHKKEALETLSRLCYEIEFNENNWKRGYRDSFPIPYSLGNDLGQYGKMVKSSKVSISQTIAECVIKAVYELNASLIVSFTSSGSTVLKISKLRSPCPIIAVTTDDRVARQVSMLASVTAVKVGSFYGSEGLSARVITIAKDKNWVKPGDFIVVTYGDMEGVAGSTNSLKIVKVP